MYSNLGFLTSSEFEVMTDEEIEEFLIANSDAFHEWELEQQRESWLNARNVPLPSFP